MSNRFLQIHTLTSYGASLLNRDDVGFAKRIPFGDAERTRISSQCLKRHWRTAEGPESLSSIRLESLEPQMSIRSRRTFDQYLLQPLKEEGHNPEAVTNLTLEILRAVFPQSKAKKKQDASESAPEHVYTDQITVIGRPEMNYLLQCARDALDKASSEAEAAKIFKDNFKGELAKNLKNLGNELGPGLDAALFGRMTTGDVLARCDAAIHVAHSFTVHSGQFEADYFSAIDDLQEASETGSGHINTAELSTGLFYGYVVVDVPQLVSNLQGCPREDWEAADRTLAGEVVRRLIKLVATVSPGAKLGSTAPYSHASLMLLESGNAQPRTLANAFLTPAERNRFSRSGASLEASATAALADYLKRHDDMYGREGERRLAAMDAGEALPELADAVCNLNDLGNWAKEIIGASHEPA